MKKEYVEIVLDLPIERIFHYSLPEELREKAEVGKRVLIPLGRRKEAGFLLRFVAEPEVKEVKDVFGILDEIPVFDEELLGLGKWIADYYFCSLGQALGAIAPPLLRSSRLDASPSLKREVPPYFEGLPPLSKNLPPQAEKADSILRSINKGEFSTILVAGEKRWQIYLRSISETLKRGQGVIFLLPEIYLTSRVIARFRAQFEEGLAILHSRLSPRQRYREWRKIKEGEASVVVGTRLAVFAPLANPGLIIVDEEEDPSYKQEEAPRYWAREVAIKRAEKKGAVVLLGSNTPSLGSYYRASQGEYGLVTLASGKEEGKVKIIDMRREPEGIILSRPLKEAVEKNLEKEKKTVLLINRRGFANFLLCRDCGRALLCPNCLVSLTYYFKDKNLYCHYCNYQGKAPDICPHCRGYHLSYFGTGTERVEEEVKKLFPQVRILRMDKDVVPRKYSRKKSSQETFLSRFQEEEIDILVGTRMALRALDLPEVTLVGVILADTSLHLPDFRSGERTFRLLTQVTKRDIASREVIIQTYNPQSHALSAAGSISYEDFYEKEISARRELKYPPFSRLVRIIIRGPEEAKVEETILSLGKTLSSPNEERLSILGPAPCPLRKLRGKYRWHIIVKGDPLSSNRFLKSCLDSLPLSRKLDLIVDADPLAML